jgi:hypothetical protein
MTTALNGCGLDTIPELASNVGSGSLGTDWNSNVFTRQATKRKTVFRANGSPKQIRFPINLNKIQLSLTH